MKKLQVSLMAIALVVVLVILALRIGDTSTNYAYKTYADIPRNEDIRAASVPEFVPKSAIDIVGWYNVEFNEQSLEFTFNSKDTEAMVKSFREVRGEEAEMIKRQVGRYSWKNLDLTSIDETYSKEDQLGDEYLVIDSIKSKAFYLSTGH